MDIRILESEREQLRKQLWQTSRAKLTNLFLRITRLIYFVPDISCPDYISRVVSP